MKLTEVKHLEDQLGRLVFLDNNEKVYVICEIDITIKKVLIVELDRPNDGFAKWIDINRISLLTPMEVLEKVKEWGD